MEILKTIFIFSLIFNIVSLANAADVRYITNSSSTVKVGVDLDLGGAISEIYYRPSGTGSWGTNIVDNHDSGRLIQITTYDDDCSGGYDGDDYDPWGWNPMQGGDCENNSKRVTSFRCTSTSISIELNEPYLWNVPNQNLPIEADDVKFMTKISFDSSNNKAIKLEFEVQNNSSIDRSYSYQDLPCLYAIHPYMFLHYYDGDNPWDSDNNYETLNLSTLTDGTAWLSSSEHWFSLGNNSYINSSIGITYYSPELPKRFKAQRIVCSSTDITNTALPAMYQNIKAGQIIHSLCYIYVGNVLDGRDFVESKHINSARKTNWEFTNNTDSFYYDYTGSISTFEKVVYDGNDCIKIISNTADPYIIIDPYSINLDSDIYDRLSIRMKVNGGTTWQLYFTNSDDSDFNNFNGTQYISQSTTSSGWVTYTIDLSSVTNWDDTIVNLRFDPAVSSGKTCYIDHIRFYKNGTTPLYRCYNSSNGDHFYTTSSGVVTSPPSGYAYETIEFNIYTTYVLGRYNLYRYYNSSSGDHFYTTTYSTPSGYFYEGVVGYVYTSQISGTVPIYRFYNSTTGDHFYSSDVIVKECPPDGYVYEGIAFYAFK